MDKKIFLYLAELRKNRFCFGANKSKKVCNLVPLFFTISNGKPKLN